MTAVLEAQGVRKVYRGGDLALVEVLNHVDLSVLRGEVVAIVGSSGAGKSTLLHMLGALDEPTGGDIRLNGVSYASLPESARDELRNRDIGFVFQFHHLLREFTALENVMMPLLIAGWDDDRARARAEELLAAVDLAGRMAHRPTQLSGGEQQRCAVARATVHDPKLLLADEPSGNLDNYNSGRLNELLFGLVRKLETSLVVVTHNPLLAQRADRTLLLQNGRLQPVRLCRGVALMQCDNCRERDASIHLTQIVDNSVTQLHLCDECAAEKGVQTGASVSKLPLSGFLASVGQGAAAALPPGADDSSCGFCGGTLQDFRETGRLGCPHCYETFEQQMRDLLRRIHGASQHVGEVYLPAITATYDDTDRVLSELRDQLKRAVHSENFELAAELRDRIRGME